MHSATSLGRDCSAHLRLRSTMVLGMPVRPSRLRVLEVLARRPSRRSARLVPRSWRTLSATPRPSLPMRRRPPRAPTAVPRCEVPRSLEALRGPFLWASRSPSPIHWSFARRMGRTVASATSVPSATTPTSASAARWPIPAVPIGQPPARCPDQDPDGTHLPPADRSIDAGGGPRRHTYAHGP